MADQGVPATACPGRVLGPISRYISGSGTHVYGNDVVSSLLGRVNVSPAVSTSAPRPAKRLNKITGPVAKAEELATISVARHGRKREVLPDVGNLVLARVVRLMPKQAIVTIQQVGETVLQTEWQGVIRVQDVRATEKDKVKIQESFKPGDIVRAQVVGSNSSCCRSLFKPSRNYSFYRSKLPCQAKGFPNLPPGCLNLLEISLLTLSFNRFH